MNNELDKVDTNIERQVVLPKGWIWVHLQDIALKINPGFPSGKHTRQNQGIPHLRPMNINEDGKIDLSVVKYIQPKSYDALLAGDILFNNTNSPALVGKTAHIKDSIEGAYSNHMTRIRLDTSMVNTAWISFFLHSLFLEGFYRMNCVHHVNQASISSTFLAEKVPIPLAPLEEQNRIVSKIEQLFEYLDVLSSKLTTVKHQLNRLRRSLLKSAFEGKLTKNWREIHHNEFQSAETLLKRIEEDRNKKNARGKYYEYPSTDAPLYELPESWIWTTIGTLFEVKPGSTPITHTTKLLERRYSLGQFQ